jgi:hypothetical protein
VSKADVGMVLCAIIGLFLLVLAIRDALAVNRLRRRGLRTEGMVIDNVRVEDSKSGPSWVPVIAFTDNLGYRVEFAPQARGAGLGLSVGRRVGVIYMSHSPHKARVRTWRHLILPMFWLSFAAIAFLGTAVLIVLTG